MNIYTVIPGRLFQCAEFINKPIEHKLGALMSHKIDVVINVYKHRDEELEEYLYRYWYDPIPDGKSFDPKVVLIIAHEATELIRHGHVVLVHCHAGRNRSGLVSALIAREYLGISGAAAMELVRTRRPRAIDNQYFEDFLKELK